MLPDHLKEQAAAVSVDAFDGDAIKAFYVLQGQNGAWDTKVRGCSSAPNHAGC